MDSASGSSTFRWLPLLYQWPTGVPFDGEVTRACSDVAGVAAGATFAAATAAIATSSLDLVGC